MAESRREKHHRHRYFLTATITGIIALAVTLFVLPAQALSIGSIAFFLAYLVLTFSGMRKLTAHFLKAHAADTDAPVVVIFGITFVVIAVAVLSLFLVINDGDGRNPVNLIIAVAAVVLGWFMVHAMAAHHYAYEYYDVPDTDADTKPKGGVVGGLDFPTGPEPDGISFVYFAYVIGMTAQVADVAITSVHMQRLVMMHGIFSFFFNTVIIAATVNLVVNLGA